MAMAILIERIRTVPATFLNLFHLLFCVFESEGEPLFAV
jgi:hypothetical protein